MAPDDVPGPLSLKGRAVRLSVRVQPRASRTEVVGVIPETGALKVRLAAPPVDGAANEALLAFLGRKVLGLSPSSLTLVSGHTGRDKVVEIDGMTLDDVARRLGIAP